MTKHLVIPDCQIRPGDDTGFLTRIGHYIVEKQPDVIVCIGDFADMPSLSSYDVGKKAYEGRRYLLDIEAVHDAMDALVEPIVAYNIRQQQNRKKQYHPRMVMTLGNHENRINRAVNSDPKLEGLLSTDDLAYSGFGWEVFPFLEVVIIDGIAYSHYFVTGVAGRAASTAAAQFRKTNMSCIAGHQQGLHIHSGDRADGARLTSIIAGSCYEHDEDYLGPQGNKCWRGILVLHEVNNGQFDLMPVSLEYLNRKYG
jgi:Calcineurin-like phosphoesterase